METFIAVFTQLGVDSSLVPQFVIITVVFILANFLFLRKLEEVIQTREEKTVKLENSADETLEKIQKMQTEYKAKIDEANRDSQKKLNDEKQKLINKYTAEYKQVEKDTNQFVEQTRADFSKELASNKDKYLGEAEALSQSLVQKILQ